jgi:hypothetical protein
VRGGDYLRRYYEALHALAPAVIVEGAGERLVLADVADPASIGRICAQMKFRVVGRASAGVALLERE